MTTTRLPCDLAARGVGVRLNGGDIVLRPASAVPDQLLAEVRRQKPAILRVLGTAGAVVGPRVTTPKGPGQLRWRGRSGRLGVLLDSDPLGWCFFDPEDVQEAAAATETGGR